MDVKKPARKLKGEKGAPEIKQLGRTMVPEVFDSRTDDTPWRVREADTLTGSTNHARREMIVPIQDGPEAESVRIHEMLHARVTPPNLMRVGVEKHGITVDSLQACEDMRINYIAKQHGITEIHETPVTAEQVEQIITKLCAAGKAVEQGPSLYNDQASKLYHRAACVAAALINTQHKDLAQQAIHDHAPRDVFYRYVHAWNEMEFAAPSSITGQKTPGATIRAARHLDKILQRHTKLVGGEQRLPGGDPKNEVPKEPPPHIEGPNVEAMINCLEVYTPELKIRLRKRTRQHKKTSDAGTLWRPTEAMRLDGTGLPFRRKLRGPMGCAILIDSSGSMGFGHEQLHEIVANIPGALVMLHASNHVDGWEGEKGTFAVVGADEHVIDVKTLSHLRDAQLGGGNANDAGACLLATKLAAKYRITGPRFWVTDKGWGNLHGEIRRGNVHEVCEAAARKGNFKIVPAIEHIWANVPTLELSEEEKRNYRNAFLQSEAFNDMRALNLKLFNRQLKNSNPPQ